MSHHDERDAETPAGSGEGLQACVLGSTGLVGRQLVRQLLAEPRVAVVRVFQRRSTGVEAAGLRTEEHLVDFEDPRAWHSRLRGDVLFSALGTTRTRAGSAEAQYRVDHDYQVEAARAAATNGVPVLILVSAMGAKPGARAFYSRMKGEIEEEVAALPFRRIHLLRPGILDGNRDESRPMERLGILLARGLARLGAPPALRPIQAEAVARAMIRPALAEGGGGIAGMGGDEELDAASHPPSEAPRIQVHEQADLFRLAQLR